MSQKSLIYAFVSRGTVILASYTEFSGNFNSVAFHLLQKLPDANNKFTYNVDDRTFNYLVDNGYTYCVVAGESAGRQLPKAFLERIKDDFISKYGGGKAATSEANGLNKEFGPKLKEHMQYCVYHSEDISKLAKGKEQVSEVKGVVVENIEKVLDRGEKIELLGGKAATAEANSLNKEFGPKLKEHMQYCVDHPEDISKLAKGKEQVSEVKSVVMENIEKVLDKGEKIELLVVKTESLHQRKQEKERNGGDHLAEDIMIEIFSWLPVETVLQFKSGCKSWYAFISSSRFISKHMKNYYSNSDTDYLFVQYGKDKSELLHLVLDQTDRVVSHKPVGGGLSRDSSVYGPCDGVFFVRRNSDNQGAFWNPATNEVKYLPTSVGKKDFGSLKFAVSDFGFDPLHGDYKVILIEECRKKPPSSVFLYSSSTDSWRNWGHLVCKYVWVDNRGYICLKGAFYWLGFHGAEYAIHKGPDPILSFDMTTDSFLEIRGPRFEYCAFRRLGVYRESLALFKLLIDQMDIWTLNEGRWTKQFTLGFPLPGCLPFGLWKNDKIILEHEGLMIYDLVSQEMRELGFERQSTLCERIFVYRRSLVSFNT